MSAEIFVILLFAFSTTTSLITEVLKKLIKSNKVPIDIVVIIVALLVGIIGMICWYVLNGTIIGSKDIVFTFLMVIANALTAMLGYDKVVEAIRQINGGK